MTENEIENPIMSTQAFAVLGSGKIAYVKSINSEDVHGLYPQAPEMQPGMKVCSRACRRWLTYSRNRHARSRCGQRLEQ